MIMQVLMLALLFGLTSCTTKVRIGEVPSKWEGSELPGIPFRVLSAYTIRVYGYDAVTGEYRQVFAKQVNLPDKDHLYTLNYSAQYFANPEFEATFNEDGTLKAITASGDSSADELLQTVGKQAVDVANARFDFENTKRAARKARIESESNVLEAENSLLTGQLSVLKNRTSLSDYPGTLLTNQEANLEAALKALQNAEAAERFLANLPNETKAMERANAESNVRYTRLLANHAYRRAGLPEPYPSVSP